MTELIDFSKIDGVYSDNQRRINEVIQQLFPTVRVIRLPESHSSFTSEKPFALVDEPNLTPQYIIRCLYESEIDHRLIAELVKNNLHDPNSEVNKLQLLEMAEQLLEAKKEQEYFEERKDIMRSAMASNKSSWTHNGKTIRK
jgi:hypothetical protein